MNRVPLAVIGLFAALAGSSEYLRCQKPVFEFPCRIQPRFPLPEDVKYLRVLDAPAPDSKNDQAGRSGQGGKPTGSRGASQESEVVRIEIDQSGVDQQLGTAIRESLVRMGRGVEVVHDRVANKRRQEEADVAKSGGGGQGRASTLTEDAFISISVTASGEIRPAPTTMVSKWLKNKQTRNILVVCRIDYSDWNGLNPYTYHGTICLSELVTQGAMDGNSIGHLEPPPSVVGRILKLHARRFAAELVGFDGIWKEEAMCDSLSHSFEACEAAQLLVQGRMEDAMQRSVERWQITRDSGGEMLPDFSAGCVAVLAYHALGREAAANSLLGNVQRVATDLGLGSMLADDVGWIVSAGAVVGGPVSAGLPLDLLNEVAARAKARASVTGGNPDGDVSMAVREIFEEALRLYLQGAKAGIGPQR